jgi:hypothetical protein
MKFIFFALSLIISTGPCSAQKLYGYIFCKTLDSELKDPAEINYLKIKDLFQNIAATLNYSYVDRSLKDEKYNQLNVESFISRDSFEPNDIVFIYINTHGKNSRWSSESLFPLIDVPKTFLSSERLFVNIAGRKPKVCMALIEACNGYDRSDTNLILQEAFLDRERDVARDIDAPDAAVIENNLRTLLSLPDKYIVCAGEKGMITYALSDGSVFTNKFIKAFKEAMVYKDASRSNWRWILETSKKYTSDRTQAFTYKHSPIWQKYVSGKLTSQGILDTLAIVRKAALNVLVRRKKILGLFNSKFRIVEVSINSSKQIDSVTYFLHRTMPDSIVTVLPRIGRPDRACRYTFSVWGEFPIKAIVHFTDRETEESYGEIIFADRANRREDE